MHGPHETVHSPSTRLPELLGPVKGTKHTPQPSLSPCRVPKNLSGLDLGRAVNAEPTWDSAIANHCGA